MISESAELGCSTIKDFFVTDCKQYPQLEDNNIDCMLDKHESSKQGVNMHKLASFSCLALKRHWDTVCRV